MFNFFEQVEGKGNGIKTVIVNMVDVAKALNRPPTCMFFFFLVSLFYLCRLFMNMCNNLIFPVCPTMISLSVGQFISNNIFLYLKIQPNFLDVSLEHRHNSTPKMTAI